MLQKPLCYCVLVQKFKILYFKFFLFKVTGDDSTKKLLLAEVLLKLDKMSIYDRWLEFKFPLWFNQQLFNFFYSTRDFTDLTKRFC